MFRLKVRYFFTENQTDQDYQTTVLCYKLLKQDLLISSTTRFSAGFGTALKYAIECLLVHSSQPVSMKEVSNRTR